MVSNIFLKCIYYIVRFIWWQYIFITKFLLKTKQITRENNHYKIHLDKFIDYLLKNEIILPTEQNHYSIEILFYRIVMGANLTALYNTKNLKDIIKGVE